MRMKIRYFLIPGRGFFSRVWRSLRLFRLGFEMMNVPLPAYVA